MQNERTIDRGIAVAAVGTYMRPNFFEAFVCCTAMILHKWFCFALIREMLISISSKAFSKNAWVSSSLAMSIVSGTTVIEVLELLFTEHVTSTSLRSRNSPACSAQDIGVAVRGHNLFFPTICVIYSYIFCWVLRGLKSTCWTFHCSTHLFKVFT